MQTAKEENEALKQEIEAVKRQKAEQASSLSSLKHFFFPFLAFSEIVSSSVSTGGIGVGGGRAPEQVSSSMSTVISDDYQCKTKSKVSPRCQAGTKTQTLHVSVVGFSKAY